VSVVIRRAEAEDIPDVLRLICALADYEQLPPPDADAQERFRADGWNTAARPPRFEAWLAEVETDGATQAAGYAITFETYSSFLARPTLYLEDLFVLPEFRRHGVGSALMRHLIATAQERGCGRMEWVVLDWNTSAQEFYRQFDATHLTEWYTYRIAF
jgi:GNAT superfamily N-acetyltransferase